jgi:hypothetical protein
MTLAVPLMWDDEHKLLLDADGNSVSPKAIVDRLNLYDDLVRAVELLNHVRPPDMLAVAVMDIELTLSRVRAQAK